MSKIIIIFGLTLLLIAGVAFYQFSKSQQEMKTNGKVIIGEQTFDVEVVKDSKSQQVGLTKYNAIKENQGMLFVFDPAGRYGFWMKNMKFPIDIIFVRNDTIVSVVQNAQPVAKDAANPQIYQPEVPADKVLEIKSDLSKKYNIKTGDKVKIEL